MFRSSFILTFVTISFVSLSFSAENGGDFVNWSHCFTGNIQVKEYAKKDGKIVERTIPRKVFASLEKTDNLPEAVSTSDGEITSVGYVLSVIMKAADGKSKAVYLGGLDPEKSTREKEKDKAPATFEFNLDTQQIVRTQQKLQAVWKKTSNGQSELDLIERVNLTTDAKKTPGADAEKIMLPKFKMTLSGQANNDICFDAFK